MIRPDRNCRDFSMTPHDVGNTRLVNHDNIGGDSLPEFPLLSVADRSCHLLTNPE